MFIKVFLIWTVIIMGHFSIYYRLDFMTSARVFTHSGKISLMSCAMNPKTLPAPFSTLSLYSYFFGLNNLNRSNASVSFTSSMFSLIRSSLLACFPPPNGNFWRVAVWRRLNSTSLGTFCFSIAICTVEYPVKGF